jgi:fermentation-respiration switch protein FrsA (DUF1100 family)
MMKAFLSYTCHCEEGFSPTSQSKKVISVALFQDFRLPRKAKAFLAMTMLNILLVGISSFAFAQEENPYVPPAQKFYEFMESGKYHDAFLMLDSSLQKVISEKQNEQGWKTVRKKLGAFKGLLQTRVETINEFNAVFLTCRFDSAIIDFKIVFNSKVKIMGYYFVPPVKYKMPSYADPSNMIERLVEVKTDSFTLPGVLMLPKKGDHFPVVILVHGSGPSDRDETLKNNKPFEDIALGLAAKGIATLRYDKRTFVYGIKSIADPTKLTMKEEIDDDALSALKLAKSFKEIDPKKIFLLGHSQGATSAPRIAKLAPFVAGIIMMAGYARPFEDVILDQMTFLLPLQTTKKKADSLLEIITKQVANIKRGDFSNSASAAPLGLPPSYWRDMKSYDQVATAKSLQTRILILQGEKDYQVTMKDFAIWKQALGGKKSAAFISYPGLFHLFMPGEGKPSDYEHSGNITEKVINDIAEWIKK